MACGRAIAFSSVAGNYGQDRAPCLTSVLFDPSAVMAVCWSLWLCCRLYLVLIRVPDHGLHHNGQARNPLHPQAWYPPQCQQHLRSSCRLGNQLERRANISPDEVCCHEITFTTIMSFEKHKVLFEASCKIEILPLKYFNHIWIRRSSIHFCMLVCYRIYWNKGTQEISINKRSEETY